MGAGSRSLVLVVEGGFVVENTSSLVEVELVVVVEEKVAYLVELGLD